QAEHVRGCWLIDAVAGWENAAEQSAGDGASVVTIQNESPRLRGGIVEPWGGEFPLNPGERLKVVVSAGSMGAKLRMMESDRRTVVYIEGRHGVTVIQCAMRHNLNREAVAAGVDGHVFRDHPTRNPMWDRDIDGPI